MEEKTSAVSYFLCYSSSHVDKPFKLDGEETPITSHDLLPVIVHI